MNRFLTFFFLIAVAFETTLLSFPLTLLLVAIFSMLVGVEAAFVIFFAGIFYDLFTLRPLGVTSIYFLGVCWLISRYQRKLYVSASLLPLFFLAIVVISNMLLFRRTFDVQEIIISVIAGGGILWIANRIAPTLENRKRLSV